MEIRIGIIHSPKEIRVDVDGDGVEQVAAIESAVSGASSVLWLHDKHGNRSGIPVDKIAYVEIDAERDRKKVGFGAS